MNHADVTYDLAFTFVLEKDIQYSQAANVVLKSKVGKSIRF